MKRHWLLGFAAAALAVGAVRTYGCRSRWPKHEGNLRQTAHVQVSNVRRGAKAQITLGALASYTVHDSDTARTVPIKDFDNRVISIVDASKKSTPIEVEWQSDSTGTFMLAGDLPDGDYQIHAAFDTPLEHADIEVPLPLYTPARIHVITDRPLYEPGNVVKFRAVVLRARDLHPLDNRPGRWIVKDPTGQVLLEEKAPAGDWGVVAGTFPLDREAPTGQWHVQWVSNDATDDVPFTVEPFTLPRFRVSAETTKPYYQAGDTPVVRGSVVYSSGAPVANAQVDIQWDISGAWPPPTEWQDKLLPKKATTAANGRFELPLPQIPADLQGTATMTAHLSAVDPAGDRVAGSASVLLAQDGIAVSSVTELGDGLVEGFNNRMYVRVTTPDGHVVRNAKIKVKRAWQPNDPGIDSMLDEDGVGSLQLDPGGPVNIVIPALPYRPAPRQPIVSRGEAVELVGGEGAPLADQVEMDKWLPALEPCGKWTDGGEQARVGLRVDAGGGIIGASSGASALDRCVSQVVRGRHLPTGGERMYTLTFSFADPELPKLVPSTESALDMPPGLDEELVTAARGTRDCLPLFGAEGALTQALTWRVAQGSKDVELGAWIKDPHGDPLTANAMGCITSRLTGKLHLNDAAPEDSLGLVRFSLELPAQVHQAKPQPTTMLGYEMTVTADIDGHPSTKLRVQPGTIPELRLRLNPVLAQPGDTVAADLLRGPTWTGDVPKKLHFSCLKHEEDVDLDTERKAKLVIPAGTEGWCEVTTASARALIYIKPQGELAIEIKPEQDHYAPGQMAKLVIQTLLGGKGGKAAVGLFGVDDSLGQLVALPGPDDMGRVRPKVTTGTPAFGSLDGQALTLGRIRGANAAAATVLRVTNIPAPPDLDAMVDAHADTTFDPVGELTDHFYTALAELHAQTRKWEAVAPPNEKMTPETMADLWKKALDACEARGERVDDAYGRRLRLSLLPADLLALTDPRSVVVVGTRLPEDVENWSAWVAKEKP